MSRSDWLHRLAAGGLLAVWLLLGAVAFAQQQPSPDQANPQSQNTDNTHAIEALWGLVSAANEAIQILSRQDAREARKEADKPDDDKREAADLKAQEDMAFWASALAGLTAVQLVVGFITLWFLWKTFGEARRTTGELQRDFRANHRPLIRVRHVWMARSITSEQPVTVDWAIVNSGLTLGQVRRAVIVGIILPKGRPLPPRETDLGSMTPVILAMDGWMHPGMPQIPSGLPVHRAITGSEFIELRNGTAKFYVVGIVNYVDLDGRGRTTSCCRVLEEVGGASERLVVHDDPNYEYQD